MEVEMTNYNEQRKKEDQLQGERLKKEFDDAKKSMKPKVPYFQHIVMAFLVGGLICLIGQFIKEFFMNYNLSEKDAGLYSTICLVFLGAFLTGIGVYDKIGRVAGAGSIVPITGFANSVVSCAMEFKSEGYVFGIGALMFKVAGPVIVFGTITSWIAGFVYYIVKILR